MQLLRKVLKVTFCIIFFTAVLGCNFQNKKNKTETETVPSVNVQNIQFYSSYCIYSLEENGSVSSKTIERLTSDLLPNYTLVDSLSSETETNEFTIVHFSNPKEEYPAPDIGYLQHSGHNLSQEEMDNLQNPTSAMLITFTGTNENVIADNIQINAIIDTLLNRSNSVVTDYATYESFNSNSWKSDRVDKFNHNSQDITSQYTIHLYRDGSFCRAVTLGMGKLCLPDISIDGISCNNQYSFASLINLIGQTLFENPKITNESNILVDINKIQNDSVRNSLISSLEENAEKKGILNLKSVAPQEGDAYNEQYQIIFENLDFSSPQEEQEELISTIFGATDQVEYINHDDKVLAASNRAKQKLPEYKKLFNHGLEPGFSLLLKAPFETDNGGNEWMWIEVTEWKESKITGILQNDPFEISDLKAGAIVNTDQDDVFDYIYYHADGTNEGNETGAIISGSN
ncbi:DUF2314 domain-containing protein [Flagellimonas sp. S3867]|uniref:DUF2314 domain-containing protein n=1 Tax=Flagellimonas sp. S3867 TaxID=2768063 RepID=UPI00168369F6|nr:DUF2314 domain-containing protein [Flagellimonas sp. S3867]